MEMYIFTLWERIERLYGRKQNSSLSSIPVLEHCIEKEQKDRTYLIGGQHTSIVSQDIHGKMQGKEMIQFKVSK